MLINTQWQTETYCFSHSFFFFNFANGHEWMKDNFYLELLQDPIGSRHFNKPRQQLFVTKQIQVLVQLSCHLVEINSMKHTGP